VLELERDGPVLRITLARPERRNAFDAALIARLHDAFADVGDARAVVLTGAGPSFCAGADVDWQRSSVDLSFEENVEDALRLHRMLAAVDHCPAPVIAGVHGFALGEAPASQRAPTSSSRRPTRRSGSARCGSESPRP
jgi:methylglutaconyl-CoA hydratase